MTTRERIIAAAEALIDEDPTRRPSVRAVAGRAEVGASTLRHHFPSQRTLMDEVIARALARAYSDERIHDASLPPDTRLLECLQNILHPVDHGARAREMWQQALAVSGGEEDAPEPDGTGSGLIAQLDARVESWLEILAHEGAVPSDGLQRRAHLLLAVVDGLAISRAFPGAADPEREQRVLHDAVRLTLTTPTEAPLIAGTDPEPADGAHA